MVSSQVADVRPGLRSRTYRFYHLDMINTTVGNTEDWLVREGLMVRRFIREGVRSDSLYMSWSRHSRRARPACGALYTADLLGKAVFRERRDPSVLQFPVTLDPAAIFWYDGFTLLHRLPSERR